MASQCHAPAKIGKVTTGKLDRGCVCIPSDEEGNGDAWGPGGRRGDVWGEYMAYTAALLADTCI